MPDLSGARLNGLDLSGVNFKGVNLRLARLNRRRSDWCIAGWRRSRSGVAAEGAAGWRHASAGRSLFQAQLIGASLRGADFTDARAAGNFNKADLTGAIFVGADLGAELGNQSMGLMRGDLTGANARGADFTGARLVRTVLSFATLTDTDFSGADLSTANLAGADLTGARLTGADLTEADVTSARLSALVETDPAVLRPALNLKRAFHDWRAAARWTTKYGASGVT